MAMVKIITEDSEHIVELYPNNNIIEQLKSNKDLVKHNFFLFNCVPIEENYTPENLHLKHGDIIII